MKKNEIEVGKAYAVVPSVRKDADANAIKATVVALDAERRYWLSGSYRATTAKDGVLVRFDEPVVEAYDRFTPAPQDTLGRDVKTEAVIHSRAVLRPWEDHAEMLARWENETSAARASVDERADEFEPRLAAIEAAIEDAGLVDEVRIDKTSGRGVDGKRVVGATFRLSTAAVERLIGQKVEA